MGNPRRVRHITPRDSEFGSGYHEFPMGVPYMEGKFPWEREEIMDIDDDEEILDNDDEEECTSEPGFDHKKFRSLKYYSVELRDWKQMLQLTKRIVTETGYHLWWIFDTSPIRRPKFSIGCSNVTIQNMSTYLYRFSSQTALYLCDLYKLVNSNIDRGFIMMN